MAWDSDSADGAVHSGHRASPSAALLPVLPVPDAVLFPNVVLNAPATLLASEAAALSGALLFAVTLRKLILEPDPDDLYRVGVIARLEASNDVAPAKIVGIARARIISCTREASRLMASVEEFPEQSDLDISRSDGAALSHRLYEVTEDYFALKRELNPEGKSVVLRGLLSRRVTDVDPRALADTLISRMTLRLSDKQALLEESSTKLRIQHLLEHMEQRMADLRAEEKLRQQVAASIKASHRATYLRHQLRAIQEELGSSSEAALLRSRVESLELPELARGEVDRHIGRLERVPSEGQESASLQALLDLILEMPWRRDEAGAPSLHHARTVLEQHCEGMQPVKERILRHLAAHELVRAKAASRSASPGPTDARSLSILMFVGPPGVGKTSIARGIADAMGRKYVRMALGGIADEAAIRGHRRAYVGSGPGIIIQGLRQAGALNPVFLLDELDKIGQGGRGAPVNALLEVLDSAQNAQFLDHYLGIPVDLSDVFFITTANSLAEIPRPLLDRLEIIEFGSFCDEEKLRIAERFTVPRELKASGLDDSGVAFSPEALRCVIDEYTRESGVRNLERCIAEVVRHVAFQRVANDETVREITPAFIRQVLGSPLPQPFVHATTDLGTAIGLHYSPQGGGVMLVETAVEYDVSGHSVDQPAILLTGRLGEVLQESCRVATTCVTRLFEQAPRSVHVHVPEGAVPKDGPSAGLAVAVALASAFTRRPANPEVALSGELTLRGRVLPVGGIREKLMGAHRAGIRTAIVPRGNERDLEQLPAHIRQGLTIHLVDCLTDALSLVLLAPVALQPPASRDRSIARCG